MAILVLISTLCGASDSHPEHGKTVFEGWERPVAPPIYIEETEGEVSAEAPTEDIIEPETFEDHTVCEPDTEETFAETEIETLDGSVPKLLISMPTDMNDQGSCVYTVTVTQWKSSVLCGILLILHTEADSKIYDVMMDHIPSGIHFSYIISDNKAAVLLDGIVNINEANTEISFHLVTEKNGGKLYAEVEDYQEMS